MGPFGSTLQPLGTLSSILHKPRRTKPNGSVTYQYDELPQMSGVLWENTLTYSPTDMDFGVRLQSGFHSK